MKATRKKRRSRIVPRAIFATVCIGVVPELAATVWLASCVATTGFSVALACFTDAGRPCGEDFPPPDAGPADAGPRDAGVPDAGLPDAGHGDGGGDGG